MTALPGPVNWEYTIIYAETGGTMTSTPANIWQKKQPHLNGDSYWDQVEALGREGWEMVSASPWCGYGNGLTTGMVFVMKRPIP